MTTELAASLLAIAQQYRDNKHGLPDHVRAELEQIAGNDKMPAPMRSEARRLLIAERAR